MTRPAPPPGAPTIPPVRPDWRIIVAALLCAAFAATQAGFAAAAVVFLLVMISAALWRGLALLGFIAGGVLAIITDDEDEEVRFHG